MHLNLKHKTETVEINEVARSIKDFLHRHKVEVSGIATLNSDTIVFKPLTDAGKVLVSRAENKKIMSEGDLRRKSLGRDYLLTKSPTKDQWEAYRSIPDWLSKMGFSVSVTNMVTEPKVFSVPNEPVFKGGF